MGAYWGYLFGALDDRNFAVVYHAPISDTKSADSSSIEDGDDDDDDKNDDENASKSNSSLVSVDQNQPTHSNESSNGQPMPTNSMPIISMPKTPSMRVSVIVPSIVQPPRVPVPVLQPADEPIQWADEPIGQ